MNLRYLLPSALLLAAIPALAAAEDISLFNATLTGTSPTQSGRLSRNGVPQDWLGTEPFPGVINIGTSYSYQTYTFAAADFIGAPYVEFSVFDTGNGASLFTSAYAGSYDPTSLATNWLGDEGSSGNYFGTDARYFDVVLTPGSNLVVVVNSTGVAGLNDPLTIDVSAYADTMYDDPAPVVSTTPEPSTFITLGTGLLGLAGVARRRFRVAR